MEGWIKINREIIEWRWYSDINTSRLFFHLLLKANYADKPWKNIIIKRGQIITSLKKLSEETSLSIQQVRYSITKLISTQDLTQFKSLQYIHLQINNYDNFQPPTQLLTQKEHKISTRLATTKEIKEYKEEKNISDAYSFLKTTCSDHLKTLWEEFNYLAPAHKKIINFFNAKAKLENIPMNETKLIARLKLIMINWKETIKEQPKYNCR